MKKFHLGLLTLFSATLLLSACQTKTAESGVADPKPAIQQETAKPAKQVETSKPTATEQKTAEKKASPKAADAKTKETVTQPVAPAQPTTPAVNNQVEQAVLVETPVQVTETVPQPVQVTETVPQPVPDNISQINAQVEEGAPDWVITPEMTEASTDDGKTLILANGEKLVWAEDTPPTKPVVAMPEHLVGKWTYQNENSIATLTISPDGQYHNHINYPNWETVHEYSGTLNQFVVESDGLYRDLDGNAAHIVPATGFGGYFVKYDTGYSILSDNEIAIHMWQISGTQDRTTYDYAANRDFTWNMTRVTD